MNVCPGLLTTETPAHDASKPICHFCSWSNPIAWLIGNGVHFGVQNFGSTSDGAACGGFRVVDVERGGGRVLVAGDVTDGGEVAADGGHVCEGGVAEVVGAEVASSMRGLDKPFNG